MVSRLPVRPQWLAAIFAGGAVGTALRDALESALPAAANGWPWATFWINLTGAVVLGGLLEGLAISGPDRGWRRGLRLGVGTGLLGGYTTYSTFAVETLRLLQGGSWPLAGGYALGSVVLGVAGAFAGVRAVRWTVRGIQRRRRHP